MATVRTCNPGNLAIQEEVWTLTITEAKAAALLLDTGVGSYWDTNLVRPTRRAVRAKRPYVTVYTAGFSTGELSNVLYNCNAVITRN